MSALESFDQAVMKVFEDKEKSRQRLKQLGVESRRLEAQLKSNKEEYLRLIEVNKGELDRIERLIKINRGEIFKASDESEKLDKKLEKTVREKYNDKKLELESKILEFRDRIAEGGRNLSSHEAELTGMVERNGASGKIYAAKKQEVEDYREMHRIGEVKLLARIASVQAKLEQFTYGRTENRDCVVVAEPSTSKSSKTGISSKDDGVVVIIAEMKRKMAAKEREKIMPKMIKIDEEDPEESFPAYSCSHCPRKLASAVTLVSHLEKHFPTGSLLPCPFPCCNYSSRVEELTRHARSKHTGEYLFQCTVCSTKLPSYNALVHHEKQHSNQHKVQCKSCLRFHKQEGPGCNYCKK